MSLFPSVHFGAVDAEKTDWRSPQFADNTPDDDAELDPTPADVVDLLGFDPAEFDEHRKVEAIDDQPFAIHLADSVDDSRSEEAMAFKRNAVRFLVKSGLDL